MNSPNSPPRPLNRTRSRLRRQVADDPAHELVVVVGRIAHIWIEQRAVIQNAASICVGAKSELAVVLAHPGVADSTEWQVVNNGLKRAIVDCRIPGGGRIENLVGDSSVVGE